MSCCFESHDEHEQSRSSSFPVADWTPLDALTHAFAGVWC